MEKIIFRREKLRNHLQPILDEWISIINMYTNKYNEDALYWYNERASVSTLAAAVWRKNNFALEEFRINKKSHRYGVWTGKADLLIICGRTEYIAEAKQLRVSISNRTSKTKDKITLALQEARDDAVASKFEGSTALGIVFVVPYIPPSEKEQKKILIQRFLEEISDVDYDAMAYTFPEKAKTCSDKKYLFPGVVCCVRVPRR